MSREIPDTPTYQRSRFLSVLDILGATHNTHETKVYQAKAALPDGYQFDIGPIALARLVQQPRLRKIQGFNPILRGVARIRYNFGSNIYVNVRNEQGQSAGRGELVYREGNGEFQNLFVEESHRHKGIGRAIIDERLQLAQLADITSLYMPYLDATNTLESYYLEMGFRQTDSGEMVSGPNPYSLRRTLPRVF